MSEWLTKAKEQAFIYWGVVLYGILFTVVSFGTAWQTATAGVDWSQCNPDAKQRIIVGCVVTWGTVMMAYISTTTSRIQKGQLPIATKDDTQFFQKPQPPADAGQGKVN